MYIFLLSRLGFDGFLDVIHSDGGGVRFEYSYLCHVNFDKKYKYMSLMWPINNWPEILVDRQTHVTRMEWIT